MSPLHDVDEPGGYGFPRVSGDEPGSSLTYQNINEFSPRERG